MLTIFIEQVEISGMLTKIYEIYECHLSYKVYMLLYV